MSSASVYYTETNRLAETLERGLEVQHTYLPLLPQLHLIQNLFYPYSKRVEGVWVECVRVEGVWVEGVWVEGVRVEDVRVEGVWVRV